LLKCGGTLADLLPHFPHALNTAEQVAAPQQLAAKVKICAVSVCLSSDGIDVRFPC